MNVYIVEGSAGIYSDKTNWIDSVYKNEESAKERIKILEEAVNTKNPHYVKEIDPINCWSYSATASEDYKPGWWISTFEMIE